MILIRAFLEWRIDFTFDLLYTITFAFFLFELIATSWAKTVFSSSPPYYSGYFLSFYWWLDMISLISLFPDVSWIAAGTGLDDVVQSFGGSNNNIVKAGRVLRLVRLVRLLRIYRIASERRKRKREEEELIQLVELGVLDLDDVLKQQKLNDHRGSQLGSHLSESITQKVIILILVIVIVLPLLAYTATDRSDQFAIQMVHRFNLQISQGQTQLNASMDKLLEVVVQGTDSGSNHHNYMLQLRVYPYLNSSQGAGAYYYNDLSRMDSIPSHYLHTEELQSNISSGVVVSTEGVFSKQYLSMLDSQLNILLTIFIALMMVVGAVIFTADAEKLVLLPIERMMNMVEAVAANPLAPMTFSYSHKHDSTHRQSMISVTSEQAGTVAIARRKALQSSKHKVYSHLLSLHLLVLLLLLTTHPMHACAYAGQGGRVRDEAAGDYHREGHVATARGVRRGGSGDHLPQLVHGRSQRRDRPAAPWSAGLRHLWFLRHPPLRGRLVWSSRSSWSSNGLIDCCVFSL